MSVDNAFNIPLGFDNWLANLVCFFVLVMLVVHIWKATRPVPSFEDQLKKLREHIEKTYATRAEMIEKTDAREKTAVSFREEMKEDIEKLTDKLSERSGEIFREVRATSAQVAHLEGRLFNQGHGK